MLEEALTEHDAEGVYYDLLLFLLGAILRTHLEEEEEEGLDGTHDHECEMASFYRSLSFVTVQGY